MDHLTAPELLLLLPLCVVGGLVQGAIGFGFALVVVPVVALIEPPALPATITLMAFPMALLIALRERRHVDRRGFAAIVAGRVFGTAAGAWILVVIDADSLAVLIGSMVVLAVVASVAGLDVTPTRAVTFGAGIASGLMGTAAAIGGPALAVVYQGRPGPELRSTLNLSFVVGLVMTLGALFLARRVEPWHATLALALLPGMLLGIWASGRVAPILDRGWLRPAVLTFAGFAGLVIVVRGLAGG